ncbi:hypothetical protein FB451DRAFT_1366346 [Mycena latifolia]|nr:hypothetical protein FB451DRAFT_1366346 [Mycena latifolia]
MSQEDIGEQLKRVEDLWFPDSNLILRAENTLFRVHSSILAARSSVFRDMVAFPQPERQDEDSFGGAPVVRLHDSAAEVEAFLRAIFDSSFFMPPPSPTDFATVIGVMRLAHKYDVQYLFRRALSHLDSMYPATLAEFLDVNLGNAPHHVDFPMGIVPDLITLRVASALDALWFLPTAYYNVCRFPAPDLLAAGEPWTALGAEVQQLCLASQVQLLRATALTHAFLGNLPIGSCSSPKHCAEMVSDARATLLEWADVETHDLDPLKEWVFAHLDGWRDLCPQCSDAAQDEYSGVQQRFWNRMPEIFGLPSWEQLRSMRRDALAE